MNRDIRDNSLVSSGLSNKAPDDIPYSRAPYNRESGTVVELYQLDDPGPLNFVVEDLIPSGFITILFGHSGLGKSYVTLYLANCVATGSPFLGKAVSRGNVLWVDFELNTDEMARRAWKLSRGGGHRRPPRGVYYHRPEWPLGDQRTDEEIRQIVTRNDISLVIVDSLSVGSTGLDLKHQRDAVQAMKTMESWGTVLAIDHITKAGARGNQSQATIYGSTFKRAISRSNIQLLRAEGGGLILRHDKANFSELATQISFALSHKNDKVNIESIGPGDPLLDGATKFMPSHEQTLAVLRELSSEGLGRAVSIDELAKAREVSEKTVRNHITQLGDKVDKQGDSTYLPAVPDSRPYESRERGMESDKVYAKGEVLNSPDGRVRVLEDVRRGTIRVHVRLLKSGKESYYYPKDLSSPSTRASIDAGQLVLELN